MRGAVGVRSEWRGVRSERGRFALRSEWRGVRSERGCWGEVFVLFTLILRGLRGVGKSSLCDLGHLPTPGFPLSRE